MYKILLILFINSLYGGENAHSTVHFTLIDIIPFIGILLSIALIPLINHHFWEKHYGKVAFFWASAFIIPFYLKSNSSGDVIYELFHVMLLEYIPFIVLLLSLFTVAGGICLRGTIIGTPKMNLSLLTIGTILASWMGTTGAAMLLIRPLLRANKDRKHKVHIVIFFIFLVANIGGSLTPLGDPPLFLGFLKGVDFFWTTKAMFFPMVFMIISLLIIFYFYDSFQYRKESDISPSTDNEKIGIRGSFNLLLIAGVVFSVLLSGFWKPNIDFTVFHVHVELQNLTRDGLLLLLTYLSWNYTSKEIREGNEYTWFPIQEVAKLFAGIFITIIPAIAILKAGTSGALSAVINSVSSDSGPVNHMYFWLTGILSSFLDNAPTYLVFFNTAGGDAQILMSELSQTLLAISAGAVFMGANTYIGNAPNFMVKSIAESSGIEMPSFFGYFFYSIIILFPLFGIVTFLFF